MGVTLLDPKTTAALQRLLEASAARPLRDTSAAFTTAFPDGGTTAFHALACLLVLLKVTVALAKSCRVCDLATSPPLVHHLINRTVVLLEHERVETAYAIICRMDRRRSGRSAWQATACCSQRTRCCRACVQKPLMPT